MYKHGLIAKKLGMTALYDANGSRFAVTLLHLESNCSIIGFKTQEKHGYSAVIVGSGSVKDKHLTKPLKGMYQKLTLEPKKVLKEFRIPDTNNLSVGQKLSVDHFSSGEIVDIVGQSTGKGFAGSMKRWNFSGLGTRNGISVSHRSHGSTGQCQDPGKVFKNKKMAGHLGCETVTVQNLRIHSLDKDKSLIIIKGAIPGNNGSYVSISPAVKISK